MTVMNNSLYVEGVSAKYGLAEALDAVSVTVRRGSITGLLGRNGAGKTTLLRSIIRDPLVTVSGSVGLGDVELTKLPTYKIARLGVAWVPDNRRIFTALSVQENLELAKGRRGGSDILERTLDAVPLVRRLLKRRGYELSGGEQQAVSIARALMDEPDFLLLDEPTEGLAPLIVEQLQESIARLPETFGLGILIAEQTFEFVTDLSDDVLVLETGRAAWSGPAKDLAADAALVDRLLSVGGAH
jgi:branched-chain amino acid transport system ATP-binding protein